MARINRGAAAAILDVVVERRKERVDRESKLREWNQRLFELGVKVGLDDGTMEAEFDPEGVFTGRFKKSSAKVFDPASLGLEPSSVKQGNVTYSRPPQSSRPPQINPQTIMGQLPLTSPGLTAEGQPKSELDFSPDIGGGQGLDFTRRELLGRVTNAIMQDPTVINRGSFNRVISTAGLEPQLPRLKLLAQSLQERSAQGPREQPAQDLPDPNDPSFSEDGQSTEGAQWQQPDGSIWEIQNGQWVRIL